MECALDKYEDGRSDYEDRYFTVDRDYVKHEAEDAWTTFFAPFSGLYRAVTRKEPKR